jgi:hypothetical protein
LSNLPDGDTFVKQNPRREAEMLSRLGETFRRWTQEELANTQLEALVDAVLLVMYADRAIKAEEQDELDRVVQDLPWQGKASPEAYLSKAIARVKKAGQSDEEMERYLSEIALKVETPGFASELLDACAGMAEVDRQVQGGEKVALERLKAKLLPGG